MRFQAHTPTGWLSRGGRSAEMDRELPGEDLPVLAAIVARSYDRDEQPDNPPLIGPGFMDAEKAVEALLERYPVVIVLPVQWGDQDAFGHVNNTVYFRWFESARIAYFQRMGLLAMRPAERIGPILASSSCEYRRSITFPDTVHVGIRVTRIGRTSIGFEHRIVSQEHAALAAEGTSTTVVINYAADNRPYPVPVVIRQAVEALEGNHFGS
jgi:acyl-CoA thioester hydrolase